MADYSHLGAVPVQKKDYSHLGAIPVQQNKDKENIVLGSQEKANPLLGAVETAIAGPSGMASREPLATANEAVDVLAAGTPRNLLRYPRAFSLGGAPAVN